jgi:hypothetical protein
MATARIRSAMARCFVGARSRLLVVVVPLVVLLASLAGVVSLATETSATWSITSMPDMVGPQNNCVTGVSCARPSLCVAVGCYSNGANADFCTSGSAQAW